MFYITNFNTIGITIDRTNCKTIGYTICRTVGCFAFKIIKKYTKLILHIKLYYVTKNFSTKSEENRNEVKC